MRRWTGVIAAGALALGTAPAGAGDTRATDRDAAARAWLRERARLGAALPDVPNADAAEVWGSYARVVDAGDLDGDGGNDLLDVRSTLSYDETTGITETVRLVAHRGRDGALLWSRDVPPSSYVFATPARVGVDGKPGVVVVAYADAGGDVEDVTGGVAGLVVTSFNGAGIPLWTRAVEGGYTLSPVAYGESWTMFDGFLDAVAGGGTDLLLRTATGGAASDPTGAVYESRGALQFSVLDAATGAVRPVGGPVEVDYLGASSAPVGDLDGDTLDDVVVEVPADDSLTLVAFGSALGTRLWQIPGYDDGFDNEVVRLPDVTGDGVGDVGVRTSGHFGSFGGTGARTTFPAPPSGRVLVVDGARGKVVSRTPADDVAVVGNADRRAGAELMLGTYVRGSRVGFTVGVHTGAGRRLWSATRTVTLGSAREWHVSYGEIGDATGDGVADIGYAVVAGTGGKARRDEGVIDGRTGRVRRDPRPDMRATRSALDGRGSDAYVRAAARGVFTLEAWRGDRPERLWTTAVRLPGVPYGAAAVSVDGDKCGDLAMTLSGDDDRFRTVVYSGSAGRPLWVLDRAAGGEPTVVSADVTASKVYRRGC